MKSYKARNLSNSTSTVIRQSGNLFVSSKLSCSISKTILIEEMIIK